MNIFDRDQIRLFPPVPGIRLELAYASPVQACHFDFEWSRPFFFRAYPTGKPVNFASLEKVVDMRTAFMIQYRAEKNPRVLVETHDLHLFGNNQHGYGRICKKCI